MNEPSRTSYLAAPVLLRLHPGLVLALVIAAVFGIYLEMINDGMVPDATDWAMYVMHARNIITGHPYAETGYIFQPESSYMGANSYPSGFPLMLVPFYVAFGFKVRVFKVVSDVALALSLWPIYIFSRRFVAPQNALLIVVATAFCFEYVVTQNTINSDAPYQLLSFAALVFLFWIYDRGNDVYRGWIWGALAGLLCAAAYLIRPVGAALLLAVAATELARRRKLSVFAVALLVTFASLVLINNAIFHKDDAYKSQFIFSSVLIARHAITYLGLLSYVFANPLSHALRYLLWLPSVLLALLGLWTSVQRKGLTLVESYWVIMLGVLFVYHIPNARYLLPLLPIYLVYTVLGAEAVLQQVPQAYRSGLRLLGVVALLLAPAINLARIRTFNQETLIARPTFDHLCQQIGARTGAHEYLLFWNPRVLALYTNRPSSTYPLSNPLQVQRFLNRIQPNYIVYEKDWKEDRKFLAPVIEAQPQRYVTVYENAQFKLMEVVGAPNRRLNPPAPIP